MIWPVICRLTHTKSARPLMIRISIGPQVAVTFVTTSGQFVRSRVILDGFPVRTVDCRLVGVKGECRAGLPIDARDPLRTSCPVVLDRQSPFGQPGLPQTRSHLGSEIRAPNVGNARLRWMENSGCAASRVNAARSE